MTTTLIVHSLVALILTVLVLVSIFGARLLRLVRPKPRPTCRSCQYAGYPALGVLPNAGHCRRNAPIAGAKTPDRWPLVIMATDFCGEYSPGPMIPLAVLDDDLG